MTFITPLSDITEDYLTKENKHKHKEVMNFCFCMSIKINEIHIFLCLFEVQAVHRWAYNRLIDSRPQHLFHNEFLGVVQHILGGLLLKKDTLLAK